MQTHTNANGQQFAFIEVPKGSTNHGIVQRPGSTKLYYLTDKLCRVHITEGKYSIHCLLSTATEEQAALVVGEQRRHAVINWHQNYFWPYSATMNSLQSLIRTMPLNTTEHDILILKIEKI